jgi:hypothetical protein
VFINGRMAIYVYSNNSILLSPKGMGYQYTEWHAIFKTLHIGLGVYSSTEFLPSMCKEAFVLMPNTEKIIIVIITLK